MRLSVKGATAFYWTQAQILGDYVLLLIRPGPEDNSLRMLYLVAWKTGSITLVSFVIHLLSVIIMTMTMDDDSSGNFLRGCMVLCPL
jgi:hypothetical protein